MLPQLVGDAQLTEGGLLDGKRNDGVLDLLWKAILQHPTTALEKAKTEKEAHGEFESEHPGYCGAQDMFLGWDASISQPSLTLTPRSLWMR